MTYQEHKQKTREQAQSLQIYADCISWGELAQEGAKLEKAAKRYGLVKEFRENGII